MKTVAELRADVIDKAAREEGFRARLLADPKEAVREATGLAVPESVSLEVHEDGANVAHLVLPASGRLADRDLERIAAGRYSEYDWG